MPKIIQLPSHIADLIAAGEVVERPGSVVKELAENSIDAGATAVTVEIQNGGMTYIRVSDDGCGISPEDAPTAFLRHATSKLRQADDLGAIGTLGFRGEALAAISSVSKIDLLTRQKGAQEGISLYLEAGEILENTPAGCPEGTTIIIRDLFYNTPARLKFMKKDSAEASYVAGIVSKLALSHPEVSFKLIKDGREELHTPGDGKLDNTAYSVLGRDFAMNSLSCSGDMDGIAVSGLITSPTASRGNRGWQYFFVNGRSIKSATMQAALEQAYKNRIMTGRFPGCVLHITMALSAVDVNVHPTKTEVKFLRDKAIFDSVYYAVLSALGSETARPQVKFEAEPKKDFFQQMTAQEYRSQSAKKEEAPKAAAPAQRPQPKPLPTIIERPELTPKVSDSQKHGLGITIDLSALKKAPTPSPAPAPIPVPQPKPEPKPEPLPEPEPMPEPPQVTEEPAPQETILPEPEIPYFRVLGEALNTYIIVELSDGLLLIDKHAAHERILFNKYKKNAGPLMSQGLLMPIVCRMRPEESNILLENTDILDSFGFDVSDYGGGKLAIRQVPADIAAEDAESLLGELAQALTEGRRLDPAAMRDDLLHTLACKAAIKAGMVSRQPELENLAKIVLTDNDVRYCPHGRPVAIEMSRTSLEKQFKRIV